MSRTVRSLEARIDGLSHVGYEIWMCAEAMAQVVGASAAVPANTSDVTVGARSNAFLESGLLHARALYEFLIADHDKPRPDDMLRTDFAPEWTPSPLDAVARLNSSPRMLNKHLAHLTWERIENAGPPWTYKQVAQDILDVASAWADHVRLTTSETRLVAALRPHIMFAQQALEGSTGH